MKVLEKSEQIKKKEDSRRSFDAQAPHFDERACGSHARRLYPHVLRELGSTYKAYAQVEDRAGRVAGGVPVRPYRVLDLGCGTGALAEHVLNSLPACELTGIDISLEMLRQARRRLAGAATFVPGDSEKLPFAEGSFDAVICNDSFHHYPDPQRAVFEAWRVLSRDGVLIVGDMWHAEPVRSLKNAVLPLMEGGDVRVYSEPEIRGLLGEWFQAVEWRQVSSDSCLVVAHK